MLNSSCWRNKKVTAVHVGCFWWFIAHVLMSQRTQTKAEKVGGGINTGVCSRLSFFGLSRKLAPGWPLPSCNLNTHTGNMVQFYSTCIDKYIKVFFPQTKWASDFILNFRRPAPFVALCSISLQQLQRESGLGRADYCSLGTKLTRTHLLLH